MSAAGRRGAWTANCSLLFTEVPLLQRPAAARAAGFAAVEFWWPWPRTPEPSREEVDAFVAAVRSAGVRLTGLNFFAGDLAGPDAGAVSVPELAEAFQRNVPVAIYIGAALGLSGFNALYGNRVPGVAAAEQDDLALENLVLAASAAAEIGATVLVEPLSGPKPYPLRTADDVVAVLDRVDAIAPGLPLGLLLDVYHLATNGDDVDAVIATHGRRVAHVQLADAPGRGEPGTGRLDIPGYLAALRAAGYTGHVGLEYCPTTDTMSSLAWLPFPERGQFAQRGDIEPEETGA